MYLSSTVLTFLSEAPLSAPPGEDSPASFEADLPAGLFLPKSGMLLSTATATAAAFCV